MFRSCIEACRTEVPNCTWRHSLHGAGQIAARPYHFWASGPYHIWYRLLRTMKPTSTLILTLAASALVVASPLMSVQAQVQSQSGAPEVLAAVRHDTSRPLREMVPTPASSTREDYDVKPTSSRVEPVVVDLAVQRFTTGPMAAVPGIAFDGVGEGNPQFAFNVNSAPPDTTGEAGLTQYVQWVNTSFAIFDKANGNLLFGPAGGNTLFTGFGGVCETTNHGDPIVQYDQLADRWILTQFSVGIGNFRQCVAVSQTSDATGAWHRYEFSYLEFPDYPKLGVWPDAYYVTFNMFGPTGSSFTGGRVCAYDRAKMLNGQAATQVCFQNLAYPSPLPSDLEGQTLPPANSPNYVLSRTSGTNIDLWKFHVDFVTPGNSTFTGPTGIAVLNNTSALSVPQPGTTQKLDAISDRLMYRLGYRNYTSREALTVNHSIRSGASAIAGVRWYEFDITGGVPSVRQQATYAPDSHHRWMGSIGTDQNGNMALGYSTSSGTVQPSVRFTGRESTDPLNTMGIETNMQSGTGSQTGGLSRWGDYSTLAIDPVDDCTFWYTSEFLKANGSFNWSTRIGSFKFTSCGSQVGDFTIGATPGRRRVNKGNATTYNVTVTPSGGFSETVTFSTVGCPANTTCTYVPPSVNGGGASTLTVQTTASTPTGVFVLTIVGTSPSLMKTKNVSLIVQ